MCTQNRTMNRSDNTTIAVIGAGLSGLVTAKTCLAYGFNVIVLEKEKELGGVWAPSRRYPGVCTQNPRDTYAFSDFRMPQSFDEWPAGEDVQKYLKAYAETFDVLRHIRFSHSVKEISFHHNRWNVKGLAGNNAFEEKVDFLIICNGTYCDPYIPAIPGLQEFKNSGGDVFHTSEFLSTDLVKNKRVAVVGFGKSATDVVTEVSKVASHTFMIAREVKWKMPRHAMGINTKYLFLNRMGEAMMKPIRRNRLERVIHALGLPDKMFGTFEKRLTKEQMLDKTGLVPTMGIKDLAFGELTMETPDFYRFVHEHKIHVKKTEITSCEPGKITLGNGETLAVDTIIFGTGFNQTIPFMSKPDFGKIIDAQGNYILYRNILPVHLPNLAFVGYNSSLFSNLTSEFSALWLCEYLNGAILKPEDDAIIEEHKRYIQWQSQFRANGHCKGLNLGPLTIDYVDTLLNDMGEKLPLYSNIPDWFITDPSRYKPVKKRIMKRSGAVVN